MFPITEMDKITSETCLAALKYELSTLNYSQLNQQKYVIIYYYNGICYSE